MARKRPVQAGPAFREGLGKCAICGTRKRRREAHHVLPQQHIRTYAHSLRLPEDEERRLLRRLLTDRRNRLVLCAGPLSCHAQLEARRLLVTRHRTPASAWEFAAELGEAYVMRLERLYPSGQASVRPSA
jgi:hypothetical protein